MSIDNPQSISKQKIVTCKYVRKFANTTTNTGIIFTKITRRIKKKGVPSAVGFPHCAGSGEGLFLSTKPKNKI